MKKIGVKKNSVLLVAAAVSGLVTTAVFAQPAAVRVGAGISGEPARYESDCHRSNTTAGTLFGALGGGVLGSVAGHGNAAAVVGGALLGGVLGNTIGREIDCKDQPYAFRTYTVALNGDVGRTYRWRHGDSYGHFIPTREFHRHGVVCRNFVEATYRRGEMWSHHGTACRARDGHWHFD